jgi:glycerol kinase
VATVGTVKATYGTGSSLMTVTDGVVETAGLASTIAWATKAGVQYALEGNISMAGAGVQWVGEFLGLARPVEDAVALAATVTDSRGVVFVPGMAGLGAPHWRPSARGLVAGLEAGSKAAHLARAAVEAIAFQVCDVFAAMEEGAEAELPLLRADGGATRNDELMQLQADLLGRPVLRSACEDLSALGAAWLGGLELGWWSSMSDFAALPEEASRFEPRMKDDERLRRLDAWHTAVNRALLEAR